MNTLPRGSLVEIRIMSAGTTWSWKMHTASPTLRFLQRSLCKCFRKRAVSEVLVSPDSDEEMLRSSLLVSVSRSVSVSISPVWWRSKVAGRLPRIGLTNDADVISVLIF
eukprot:Gregarina_sp_Poly_1__10060@NODE_679_length_6812_cov_83_202669_g512_i0_p9_GENE_NODE_679_length_6812_cov_83_202669_g512_i0NODE_679_length_6812_cov_83_202669_g512_i0_p9_ORF_typecomplete_len109_score11_18_NODE_679_length_6812_cov_83_202669_g512_i047245050